MLVIIDTIFIGKSQGEAFVLVGTFCDQNDNCLLTKRLDIIGTFERKLLTLVGGGEGRGGKGGLRHCGTFWDQNHNRLST